MLSAQGNKFQSNDVLVGGIALTNVLEILKGTRPIEGSDLYDLGTILESIILYERIFVEDLEKINASMVDSLNSIIGKDLFINLPIIDEELSVPDIPISESIINKIGLSQQDLFKSFELNSALWIMSELTELDKENRFLESYMQSQIIDSKLIPGVSNVRFGNGTSKLELKAISLVIDWLNYFIRIYSTEINFKPNASFVPLFFHQSKRLRQQNFSMAKRFIDLIHKKHLINRDRINLDLFRRKVFTTHYPYFLRIILQDAKIPEDCLKIALKIRDFRSAKKFRNWCAKIDALIYNEEITDWEIEDALKETANALSKEVNDKTALLRILSLPKLAYDYSVGWKLAFSFPETIISSFKVLKKLFKGRQLIFIRQMEKKLSKASEIELNVKRVFGTKLSKHDRAILEIVSLTESLTS